MDSTAQPRRGGTRQRIQDVALELFTEQGYEKTSLREIAERLDVTKAALYYHFKTKEDIVVGLFEDLSRPMDELIAWGESQPSTLEVKKEILRRYSDSLAAAAPLFRFAQENQAAMRDLSVGKPFKNHMLRLMELLNRSEGTLSDRVRCFAAIFAMHAGLMALQDVEGDPEEKRNAALEVAIELMVRGQGLTP